MTSAVDEISPREYGDDRIRLSLDTEDPQAFQIVTVSVDLSRALPAGIRLPVEFTVTGPGGSSTFHRQVFRKFVPSVLTFRPQEGGSLLVRLAELYHNKWFGVLVVDVEGSPILPAPILRNPR